MSNCEEYFDYDDEAQGSFSINCRRPNAHRGLHRPNNSTLQPLSNRYQKYSTRIRVSPLEGHLYIIDVYQAVEISHSDANEFLCQDCVHVSVTQAFFKKRGVAVMTVRELFDFKVDPSIAEEAVDSYLDEVHQKIADIGGYKSRKENKKKVKEEKREARKHRVPKAVKKRRSCPKVEGVGSLLGWTDDGRYKSSNCQLLVRFVLESYCYEAHI